MLVAVYVEKRVTLKQHHALFAVVAVEGDGGTGSKLGDPVDEAGGSNGRENQRRCSRAPATIVGLHLIRPKHGVRD